MIPESARDHWIGPKPVPPSCRVGDVIQCEIEGEMRVDGHRRKGVVAWPVGRQVAAIGPGGRHVIVTPELAASITLESELAIMRYLGVSKWLVSRWRGLLDVPRHNTGTMALRSAETGTPENAKSINAAHPLNWTAAEMAILGTVSDSEASAITGRTIEAVTSKRVRLGIPAPTLTELVAQAVAMAIASGWTVRRVASTGTHYLDRDGYPSLRISTHKRAVPHKALRRRIVSINVANYRWRQKLFSVLQITRPDEALSDAQ